MYENGKMRPVETISGMGGLDKGEQWRSELNHDILLRIFVNVTMYP
jgi:hypothetical protein